MYNIDYTVVTAVDAVKALNIFKNDQAFDCIIVDYLMPIMSGLEFINEERKIDTTNNIPIILHTGITNIDSIIKDLKLQNVQYLLKPNSIVTIRETIEKSINNQINSNIKDVVLCSDML